MKFGPSDSDTSGENRYVSTAQVSKALGISVTTVKRWVDDGVLPAHRTAGGHRKLLMADVIRLVRESNLPQADLSRLIPFVPNKDFNDPKEIVEQLAQAFSGRDAEMARVLIHGAYNNGFPVEMIADKIICPAMANVGNEWVAGKIEVMHEHRATQMVVSALYELKSFLRNQDRRERPVAVGGAPEHDHYILPTLLAKMSLLDGGWDAINLGPHTPFSALHTALDELHPRIVWVSVSHLENPERFLSEYQKFQQHAEEQGVFIAIGGRGLPESVRSQMVYTTYGDGFTQLISFARQIYRLPARPRRGRPPLQVESEAEPLIPLGETPSE